MSDLVKFGKALDLIHSKQQEFRVFHIFWFRKLLNPLELIIRIS